MYFPKINKSIYPVYKYPPLLARSKRDFGQSLVCSTKSARKVKTTKAQDDEKQKRRPFELEISQNPFNCVVKRCCWIRGKTLNILVLVDEGNEQKLP